MADEWIRRSEIGTETVSVMIQVWVSMVTTDIDEQVRKAMSTLYHLQGEMKKIERDLEACTGSHQIGEYARLCKRYALLFKEMVLKAVTAVRLGGKK